MTADPRLNIKSKRLRAVLAEATIAGILQQKAHEDTSRGYSCAFSTTVHPPRRVFHLLPKLVRTWYNFNDRQRERGSRKFHADRRATTHRHFSSVKRHFSVKPGGADGSRAALETSKRAATGHVDTIVTHQRKKCATSTRAWIRKSQSVKKSASPAQRPTRIRFRRRSTAEGPLSCARTKQKAVQRTRNSACATTGERPFDGEKQFFEPQRRRNTLQRRKIINTSNTAHLEPTPHRRVPNKPRSPTWAPRHFVATIPDGHNTSSGKTQNLRRYALLHLHKQDKQPPVKGPVPKSTPPAPSWPLKATARSQPEIQTAAPESSSSSNTTGLKISTGSSQGYSTATPAPSSWRIPKRSETPLTAAERAAIARGKLTTSTMPQPQAPPPPDPSAPVLAPDH